MIFAGRKPSLHCGIVLSAMMVVCYDSCSYGYDGPNPHTLCIQRVVPLSASPSDIFLFC